MIDGAFLLAVSAGYLSLLFGIAYYRDRPGAPAHGAFGSSAIYTLSIAVYCTSWTFFGSVGRAASGGIDFLPVYLGPTLMFFLGWPVLRKILRLSKQNRITSIADFLAARYGKSGVLAVLVTVIAVLGTVPYIALQLKAVSNGFAVLTEPADALTGAAGTRPAVLGDKALWSAVLLGLFAILFGTRRIDASEHHQGMVAAMAFDSLVKLVCLTIVGLVMFNGFGDLFARAAARPELMPLFRFEDGASGFDWLTLTLLSMSAAVCLPRQFQVVVVENVDEGHLDRSLWMFPLYLFLINLFVLPIAVAGRLVFPGGADPDTYVLILPLAADARNGWRCSPSSAGCRRRPAWWWWRPWRSAPWCPTTW